MCKYWIDPGFWNPIEVGLVNLDRWKTIPRNLQALMLYVAKEVEQPESEWGIAAEKGFLQEFREVGMQTITAPTNSGFIFEGLKNNTTKIKSIAGIDIECCVEAEAITDYSWELIIPTIRQPLP